VLVADGRAAARDWVERYVAGEPWFRGAFLTGSAVARPATDPLPVTSDVDVNLVVGRTAPEKPGKFRHRGVLLDVSHQLEGALPDAAGLARSWVLAPSFATDQILADPSGRLRALHDAVAPVFAHPAVVRERCAGLVGDLTSRLAGVAGPAPWPEQVTAWLFPSSLVTHVPLVAALRSPTVRLRYRAAREVLHAHDRHGTYRRLLELLGCADVDAPTVRRHVDVLAELFDEAAALARTPFPFSADITRDARPVAVGGSRQLVEDGDHREAVFWVVATAARCQQILAADAPGPLRRAGESRFRDTVADLLGLHDPAGLLHRREQVHALLPELLATAGELIGARAR
jgi:hypothetical protein